MSSEPYWAKVEPITNQREFCEFDETDDCGLAVKIYHFDDQSFYYCSKH